MTLRTTLAQRQEFHNLHQHGQTYSHIAALYHVSLECVRYWCRRQRDGGRCQTQYVHSIRGVLSCFHALIRYVILRLRLAHPRWGPNRIHFKLTQHPSLRGLALPSDASIGRYLHQWVDFRRPSPVKPVAVRPHSPRAVHQRWQMDFKVGICLHNRMLVNLHTVRDPVGEACIGAQVFSAGVAGHKPQRVTVEQARAVLRTCFAEWHTLPHEIQTDGEPALWNTTPDGFPSRFTLWLKGLAIEQLRIRSARPTDNAEVERCHRTVNEYAIVGNEANPVDALQLLLTQAVHELNFELPSRAEGCRGQPPVLAHPELIVHPRRHFEPADELTVFDLKRVDAYLAAITWKRKVEATGQVTLGGSHDRYSIGRCHARKTVLIKFDPTDRQFVFYAEAQPELEIARRPARRLNVSDLTGLGTWPEGVGWQQLRLPFEG